VTTADQLAAVESAVHENWPALVHWLGRLTSPAVQGGAGRRPVGRLGRLVHLTSLAPHRLNRALRPAWFFDHDAYGGISTNIGVHSIDQFLALADAPDATITACTIGSSARNLQASRTLPRSACGPTA